MRPEVGAESGPRAHGIRKMPAGQDEELAALFRDLREALNASPEVLARQLDTTPDVIAALEQGNVLGLPAWPETDRIISSYAALLGLDASPILRRIIAHLQSYAPEEPGEPPTAPPPPETREPKRHPLEISSFSLPEPEPKPPPPPRPEPPRAPPAPAPSPPWAPPPREWAKPVAPPPPAEAPETAWTQPASPERAMIPSPRPRPPVAPPRERPAEPEADANFDPPLTPTTDDAPAGPGRTQEPRAADAPRPEPDAPKSVRFWPGLKPYITSPARIAAIVGVVIAIWLIAGNTDRLMSGMPESLLWLTRGIDGDASDDPRSRKADRLPSRY